MSKADYAAQWVGRTVIAAGSVVLMFVIMVAIMVVIAAPPETTATGAIRAIIGLTTAIVFMFFALQFVVMPSIAAWLKFAFDETD